MKELAPLIGTWATEATHPLLDGVIPGQDTFEWLEGGAFLIQRSHRGHPQIPDAISVIGPPESGDGLVMEYFDTRGVRRTYAVAIDDGVLRMWREDPASFDQRMAVTLTDPPRLTSQIAETPGEWRDDLQMVFRRLPT